MIVEFDLEYEKKSKKEVKDDRVFKVVKQKFDFLAIKGMRYPSLRAKKLENTTYEGNDLWEFYVTKKWRCFFTYNEITDTVKVIKIGNHL